MADLSIREGQAAEIAALEFAIPEFRQPKSLDVLEARLRPERDALILLACSDGTPVGFKAGYALAPGTFYSWVGAVLPAFRGQGVARRLLQAQEARLRGRAYARIRVKSRNAFPGMLRLLVAEGYRIVGLEAVPSAEDPKIVFEKALSAAKDGTSL